MADLFVLHAALNPSTSHMTMTSWTLAGHSADASASFLWLLPAMSHHAEILEVSELYLGYDVVSLARIPRRHRRLAQSGIASWSGLVWLGGLAAVSHVARPLLVLYPALRVLVWKVFVMY